MSKIIGLLLETLHLYIKSLCRLWLPVFIHVEEEPLVNKPLVFIYAGYSSIRKGNFANQLFGKKKFKTTFLGVRGFWDLKSLERLNELKPDILMAETSLLTTKFFLKQKGYVLPEFIDIKIDIRDPMVIMKHKGKSDFSSVERLIRKYKWTYTVTQDEKALDDFYFNMYLPYIKPKFSDRAIIISHSKFRALAKSAFLLLVQREKLNFAGVLVVYDKDYVGLSRLGIKEGRVEYLKQGVIGALYYYAVLECQKNGYRELDLGGTYPFLNDSLTRYKLHHNGEIVYNYKKSRNHLWVSLLNGSKLKTDFFDQNPFVCLGSDGRLKEVFYD